MLRKERMLKRIVFLLIVLMITPIIFGCISASGRTLHRKEDSTLGDENLVQLYGTGWLNGWTYRKAHDITGSTVGVQTDYQTTISVIMVVELIAKERFTLMANAEPILAISDSPIHQATHSLAIGFSKRLIVCKRFSG
jgi:hypothetical protein